MAPPVCNYAISVGELVRCSTAGKLLQLGHAKSPRDSFIVKGTTSRNALFGFITGSVLVEYQHVGSMERKRKGGYNSMSHQPLHMVFRALSLSALGKNSGDDANRPTDKAGEDAP